MFCGSCLQDNAVARAMLKLGHDVVLVPTYTPILTDETNVSQDRLFYGGVNIFLQQSLPFLSWLPNWLDQFLNSPSLVNWVASKSMGTSAKKLGALTVSMLQGTHGRQRKEVVRLVDWLRQEIRPDVVVFSNLLIGGAIPEIKRQLGVPTAVILQGDDIFFEDLSAPYKDQAMDLLRKLADEVNLFLVHSRDYGLRMQAKLGFDDTDWEILPLAIDPTDFAPVYGQPRPAERAPTIGYLARLAPEKGLHLLVDAFVELHRRGSIAGARLELAGWLGQQHCGYWQEQQQKIDGAGLTKLVRYHGAVDRQGKIDFLRSIDVLSVPTVYQEPKGLFVLEALAAGIPYVQPAHGSFSEMHTALGGGWLFPANDYQALASKLTEVLSDLSNARTIGGQGRMAVLGQATTLQSAQRMVELLEKRLHGPPAAGAKPTEYHFRSAQSTHDQQTARGRSRR